jgi:pimeloyl-ACP methyl ester carboxylesterase
MEKNRIKIMNKLLTLTITGFLICNPTYSQSVKKVVLNENDFYSGYYLAVEPESDSIAGVLVLIAGFGQIAENTFPETKLQNVAYVNKILTISFACGNKLYADSATKDNLTAIIKDVISKYKVRTNSFILGGYSAGGMIALRYVELCNEFPDKYPIQLKGVFMVDSPIDIFTIWDQLEESAKNKYSELAVEEAERAMNYIKNDYGIPRDNISTYAKLTAFSMNKEYCEPEIYLRNTAVRAYHDVDIAWRLINRNQTVHNSNYEVTAELINRLLLMGNDKAEFMQTFKSGYRSNGQRHPHSWSIVDEVEFIQWMKGLIK